MRRSTRTPAKRVTQYARTPAKKSKRSAGLGPRPSIEFRYSIGGKNSLGPVASTKNNLPANKDPRQLREKSRQRETCTELAEFLEETSCPMAFSAKQLMSLSTGNYFLIFIHLAQLLLGKQMNRFGLAKEELVLKTMGLLGYPIKLQKSSFTNFSLTAWPIALGVLEFLMRLHKIRTSESEYAADLTTYKRSEVLLNVYSGIDDSPDTDYHKMVETAAEDYLSYHMADFENDEAKLQIKMDELMIDKNACEGRISEHSDLIASKNKALTDMQCVTSGIDGQNENIGRLRNTLDKSYRDTEIIVAKKSELNKRKDELCKQIGDKDAAIDQKVKHDQLRLELNRSEEQKNTYDMVKSKLEVSYTKSRDELDDLIKAYNVLRLETGAGDELAIGIGRYKPEFNLPPTAAEIISRKIDSLKSIILESNLNHQNNIQILEKYASRKTETDNELAEIKKNFERKHRISKRNIESVEREWSEVNACQTTLDVEFEKLESQHVVIRGKLETAKLYVEKYSLEKLEMEHAEDACRLQEIFRTNFDNCLTSHGTSISEIDELLKEECAHILENIKLVDDQICKLTD